MRGEYLQERDVVRLVFGRDGPATGGEIACDQLIILHDRLGTFGRAEVTILAMERDDSASALPVQPIFWGRTFRSGKLLALRRFRKTVVTVLGDRGNAALPRDRQVT